MAGRRKAEFRGMQDPLYPREPDHESMLSIIDPTLAFSLSAAQSEVARRLGVMPEAEGSEWQPRDPDTAFSALGLGR